MSTDQLKDFFNERGIIATGILLVFITQEETEKLSEEDVLHLLMNKCNFFIISKSKKEIFRSRDFYKKLIEKYKLLLQ